MNIDLKFYWALLLRRLPVMTALALACTVIGVITAFKLPPTYATSARLLVEEQQIPDSMVLSTVRTDPGQQLQVIEQRLMTRANLIDIARKHDVFEDVTRMTPDAVLMEMRRSTRINRTGGRGQATLMTITFSARSGQIAANVVNEYVTLILEANNSFRISRVENTLAFFEQEVARLGQDLDRQSAEIVTFKNSNATALPDDLAYRQDRLALWQERRAQLERDRSQAINQRNEIIAIFERTGRIQKERAEIRQSPEEQRLIALQLELDRALSVYSETNPRVVMLRRQVEQAEAQFAKVAPREDAEDTTPDQTILDVTLAEIDQRVRDLDDEIETLSAQMNTLEDSILATSTNAIALGALDREYENIERRYNEALNNLNQARMSERIEVSSQGQRISVVEGASVPQEPSGPNRVAVALAGAAAGAGLAVGFFVLLEVMNRTIRRPFELHARFNITPIAVIPHMESVRERFRRRALLVGAFVIVLIGVPAALYYIDTNYMPLDVLASRVFNRLGLT